ncbi:hypothetical protein C8Q76DRAFT_181538 [Earliella scabrosa]|nr:hypothetical protein C8Q76DRAFT_181538 [Earliella scabrosa]
MLYSSPRHLNCDILGVVAEHADRQTAARMMVCCSSLYRYIPRLLLAEPVDLECWGESEPHADHVLSFYRFMSAEDGRRWRFLRGLIMGHTLPGPPEVVSALAHGILQASNLEHLELTDIDQLLERYSDIRDALASLKNVKHLKVAYAAKHACTFLESVRWPLVTVLLEYADEMEAGDWTLPDIRQRLHPASLLRRARDTLVEISCDYWHDVEYREHFPDYPNVKILHEEWAWSPTTPEWVRTYPNLTHLSFLHSLATEDRSIRNEDARAEFEAMRRSNLQALEQRCWPHLDEVRVSRFAGFYILGLPCHVRKVDLGWATRWDLRLLPEALGRIRPIAVQLSFKGEVLATAFKTYLEQSVNALQDLEELQLHVRFDREHIIRTGVDVAHDLAEGTSALRALPKLRKLILNVSCEFVNSVARYFSSPSPSPEPLRATETALHDFDRRAFYRALFRGTPTLETVEFALHGVRGMERIDERVARLEVVA